MVFGKKLLLEFSAVGGFGGGIGGWVGNSGNSVHIESEGEASYLVDSVSEYTKRASSQAFGTKPGIVSQLNERVFGSSRFKSEGVQRKMLYVNGGDSAGKHKIIGSEELSQMPRILTGGRWISPGKGGFGPRDGDKGSLNGDQKTNRVQLNYGPLLQKAFASIEQRDLDGIQRFGEKRTLEFEETLFGLYLGREYWVQILGKKAAERGSSVVDLEFQFSQVKGIFEMGETELMKSEGKGGSIVQGKLASISRVLGNVENVIFNYVKKAAGEDSEDVKKLRGRNILKIVRGLITAEEMGFDCSDKNRKEEVGEYFPECRSGSDFNVKRVLKSTVAIGEKRNNYLGNYYVPMKNGGDFGHEQRGIGRSLLGGLKQMDQIETSPLIDEKCEDREWGGDYFLDGEKSIRRELCFQIIRPGFGDQINDKRLCLIEVKDFKNYLRSSNYLQVIKIPTGHNKNTFGTKCSNYGI